MRVPMPVATTSRTRSKASGGNACQNVVEMLRPSAKSIGREGATAWFEKVRGLKAWSETHIYTRIIPPRKQKYIHQTMIDKKLARVVLGEYLMAVSRNKIAS